MLQDVHWNLLLVVCKNCKATDRYCSEVGCDEKTLQTVDKNKEKWKTLNRKIKITGIVCK
jgi:hypothetical protein